MAGREPRKKRTRFHRPRRERRRGVVVALAAHTPGPKKTNLRGTGDGTRVFFVVGRRRSFVPPKKKKLFIHCSIFITRSYTVYSSRFLFDQLVLLDPRITTACPWSPAGPIPSSAKTTRARCRGTTRRTKPRSTASLIRDTSESEEQSKSISPYGDIAQPELWLTRGDRAARPSRAKVPLKRGVGADESPTGGIGGKVGRARGRVRKSRRYELPREAAGSVVITSNGAGFSVKGTVAWADAPSGFGGLGVDTVDPIAANGVTRGYAVACVRADCDARRGNTPNRWPN
jgi:hypothetical protein